MADMGRLLMILGALVFIVGGLMMLAGKVPFIGRLPGDIYIKRDGFTFYFPLATSILISILISLVLWLIRR